VTRPQGPTWAGFVLWVLAGAGLALATISFSVLILVAVAIGVVVLATRRTVVQSAFGLVSGVGVLAMYVAYVQRRGPGTVCWQTATASGCEDYLNPWPWLVGRRRARLHGVAARIGQMRRARERLTHCSGSLELTLDVRPRSWSESPGRCLVSRSESFLRSSCASSYAVSDVAFQTFRVQGSVSRMLDSRGISSVVVSAPRFRANAVCDGGRDRDDTSTPAPAERQSPWADSRNQSWHKGMPSTS
jgi:hypothetical protein